MTRKITAYDRPVLYAFRAMFEGKANAGQQKRVLEWLLFNACHIGALSFADSDRDTAFHEGERWIGLQIAKMREPEALARIEGKSKLRKEATEATE